jgi:hypothetical protein
MSINNNKIIFIATLLSLLLGLLFYYFFRQNIIGFNLFNIQNELSYIQLEGYINSFPSFLHVLILSLITWYILDFKLIGFSVLLWVGINLVFEFLQDTSFYFISGTFDWIDVFAIILGGFFSYFLMTYINKKREV